MNDFPYDEDWADDNDLERAPELTIQIRPHTGHWIRHLDGVPFKSDVRRSLEVTFSANRLDALKEALLLARLLPTMSVRDFGKLPRLTPLVEGVLNALTVALLYGPSGSLKTALVLDLVIAMILGEPWAGHKVVQGNVLYVALEGGAGLRQRLKVAEEARGISLGHRLQCCFDRVNIACTEDVANLAVTAFALGSRLIVIDTLSASIAGEADENSNRDMSKVIALMNGLATFTGAAVLIIHHTGHGQDRERGASSLRNNVDTSISVTRNGDNCAWETVKQKDGEAHIGGLFEPMLIEGPGVDGEQVTSIAVRHLGPKPASRSTSGTQNRRSRTQEAVLTTAQELCVDQRLAVDSTGQPYTGILKSALIAACRAEVFTPNPKHQTTRINEAISALIRDGAMAERDGRLTVVGTG